MTLSELITGVDARCEAHEALTLEEAVTAVQAAAPAPPTSEPETEAERLLTDYAKRLFGSACSTEHTDIKKRDACARLERLLQDGVVEQAGGAQELELIVRVLGEPQEAEAEAQPEAEEEASSGTVSQENARRSAEDYLETSARSPARA